MADLKWTIGADWAEFQKGVTAAKEFGLKMLHGLGDAVGKLVQGFKYLIAAAIGLSVAMAAAVAKMIGVGAELSNLAKTSGFSATEILRTQLMLQRMGASASDASGLLSEMRQNLLDASSGLGEAAFAANALGLNVAALRSMNPSEAFEAIADALKNVAPVQRMQMANALLGSMGAEAVGLAVSGREVDKLYGSYIKNLATAAKDMSDIKLSWDRIKTAGTVFFGAIAAKIAPVFNELFNRLLPLFPKIVEAGEKFGKYIADAVTVLMNAFKSGQLMSLLDAVWDVVLANVTDTLIAAAKGAGAALLEAVTNILPVLVSAAKTAGEVLWKTAQNGLGIVQANDEKHRAEKTKGELEGKASANAPQIAVLKEQIDAMRKTSPEQFKGGAAGKVAGLKKAYADLDKLDYGSQISAQQERIQSATSDVEKLTGTSKDDMAAAADDLTKQIASMGPMLKSAFVDGLADFDAEMKKGKGARDAKKSILDGLIMALGGDTKPQGDKPDNTKMATWRGPFSNVFDELRKIGGGLGKGPEKGDMALEYQKRTAVATEKIANRKNEGLGSGFTARPAPGIFTPQFTGSGAPY